ncbi:MAG TPA: DNA primase [Gammaproteobacteria bacterium]|nr:DNA primase [Gammaproteobacteria bacterium]
MAGKIAKSFIDELLARANIVEIVERAVPLKRAGRDFQGLCPFHHEKTPSFTVSPDKQFYHCFGCGAHGSAIGFLMNHEGFAFVEAVEELAGMLGLEVQYEAGGAAGAPAADYSGLYRVMEEAQQFYARMLREHPARARAVDYLKGRGLTGEIAKRFGIGYAPPGWDTLSTALASDPAGRKLLVEAGLTVEKEDEDKFYDRFRDRVMFPIRDRRGRCVAFGGRIIDAGEPKYLNSPETPIFHKRQELYGLDQVLKRGRPDKVLIVEGYMDVVALAQFGVDNAVATLGTATTGEQIEQLYRYVPEIVFCFDGDNAGRRAAWRALETVLPLLKEGRRAGFLFLPQGHDPDSLVRTQGPAVFGAKESVTTLSSFLFDELAAKADPSTIDGKAQLVALARPLIAKIPPGPLRQLLSQHLQALSGATVRLPDAPQALRPRAEGAPREARPGRPQRPRRQVARPETRLIELLVRKPALAALARDLPALDVAASPEAALLVTLLETLEHDPDLHAGALLERFRDGPHAALLGELLAREFVLDESRWESEFSTTVEKLTTPDPRKLALRRSGYRRPAPDPDPSAAD